MGNLQESYETHDFELENKIIGCLIKNPNEFFKYSSLEEGHFFDPMNSKVFGILRNELLNLNGAPFSVQAFKDKVLNHNIKFVHGVESSDFIDDAVEWSIAKSELQASISSLLLKYKIYTTQNLMDKMSGWLSGSGKRSSHKVLGEQISKFNGSLINAVSFGSDEHDFNTFQDSADVLQQRKDNPIDDVGFRSSLSIYHSMFGSFRPCDLHIFHANQGVGKSSLMMQIGMEFVKNTGLNCLYLDTELSFHDQIVRTTMANTGIHHEDIQSGKYISQEDSDKVQTYIDSIREATHLSKLAHKLCKGMSIDKKVDFMRVWRMKHTDMTQPAMLIYDYLNVAGERNKNEGTHLDMSDQINKVMTVAKELNIIVITAMQTNRSGDVRNRNNNSGASASIGGSFKACEDANHSIFFEPKGPEEIAEDECVTLDTVHELLTEFHQTGDHSLFQFGTHKLLIHKVRWPGKRWRSQMYQASKRKYNGTFELTPFYINLCLSRGSIVEKGSLEDVIEYQRDNNPDANQNSPNAGPEERGNARNYAQENENLL
jgi:hypothetical protein|tara:strand:+ start:35268 stop:36896 length:1629 start_codon:yes stop_codon:yes gene_type:complete